MNFQDYYLQNQTYQNKSNYRIEKIISIIIDLGAKNVLDVGCGDGFLLNKLADKLDINLTGIDAYNQVFKFNAMYRSCDITIGLPFKGEQFDCIILGEVIEHVPNPDFILREINRVTKNNGYLIISTPNLVSWANRILVPLGFQPLFTETSSEVNLGRVFKLLGQGGKVQGHLKIFTHRSLQEILERSKYEVIKKQGAPFFFPFPISIVDKVFLRFPSLASDLIYTAKKTAKNNVV